MQIRVLFFGVLRDALAQGETVLELAAGATAGAVLAHYRDQAPGPVWNALAVAVNQHYALLTTPLADGDEVALLPPVSGGAGEPWVRLTREPINSDEMAGRIKQGEDGAIVTFDGVVRNNTRGRETLFLDYQGYEGMALAQMEGLAVEAASRYSVRSVAIVHRLGRLAIGETSVLVIVASAHRGAAFDACRWIIDTLKKTVPIWKKEHFVDGAAWADGEPFPEDVAPGGEGA